MPDLSESMAGSIFRAPGKVVLAGEYAVLDGAPAIVMAIDRGVECEVFQGSGIVTPDGDTRFVKAALGDKIKHNKYVFRSYNPVLEIGKDQKAGFGGSAAACVVACLAAGRQSNDAFSLHHQTQGSGSGIDIAAAIHGGVLWFCQGEVQKLPPIEPIIVWSGNSAKTGPRVLQYLSRKDRKHFVEKSTYLVNQFSKDPIQCTKELLSLLIENASVSGIDYMTPALKNICDLAQACGGAAKPSGAGGGDCAVAFLPPGGPTDSFHRLCLQEGHKIISASLSKGAHSLGRKG